MCKLGNKDKFVKCFPLLVKEMLKVYENVYQGLFSVFKNSPKTFEDLLDVGVSNKKRADRTVTVAILK